MFVRAREEEEGFAMILAVLAVALILALGAAALTATGSDLHLTQNDFEHKRSYQAAQAGIADYAFHLNADTNYWTRCTNVPTPTAVNQQTSTANWRTVAGSTDESYAIQLIPATGQSSCVQNSAPSMLEQGGSLAGSFRIRSIGYAGATANCHPVVVSGLCEKQSVTATFKRASFLDYLYFTQLETSDPVTYPTSQIAGAYSQCSKTLAQGRMNSVIPGSSNYCDVISFIGGELLNGPFHTNDAYVICGSPSFGRSPSDTIEASAGAPGWYSTGSVAHSGSTCTGTPTFVGTFLPNAPVLTPPPSNTQLTTIPGVLKFTGQVHICLSGTTLKVSSSSSTCSSSLLYNGSIPASGVVYVANGACSAAYSPFTVTYPSSSTCGTAYVHGSYSGQITIAAENDIIVDGNVTHTGDGLLGLIANNFVRVYHPVPGETGKGSCGSNSDSGSLTNPQIDAAILAINHSFIVDHYDCGTTHGTLTVNGAIAQKYRGAVGTFSGSGPVTGYVKNYNYDDRLRYETPPHFLDPVQVAWHVQRETLDYP